MSHMSHTLLHRLNAEEMMPRGGRGKDMDGHGAIGANRSEILMAQKK